MPFFRMRKKTVLQEVPYVGKIDPRMNEIDVGGWWKCWWVVEVVLVKTERGLFRLPPSLPLTLDQSSTVTNVSGISDHQTSMGPPVKQK